MFNNKNDIENNVGENEEEITMTKRLRGLTIMTVILAVLRILSIDVMLMLSDLITALMILFLFSVQNKMYGNILHVKWWNWNYLCFY